MNAYELGREAWYAGYCKSENPFPSDSEDYREWRAGWLDTDFDERVDDFYDED